MNEEDALAALALAPTRLRMVKLIAEAGADGLTAGAIAKGVGATPSRASFHLGTLATAGVLVPSRQSRQVTYRVNFERVGQLLRYILVDCCRNDADARIGGGMASYGSG